MSKVFHKGNYNPDIFEFIKRKNLLPKKSLGQNFLLSTDTTDKIVKFAGKLEGFNIIEIGPGAGTLTRSLLHSKAKKIVAIEKDQECFNALQELMVENQDRLQIINADAMKISEEDLVEQPLKIIANLPYNIGTELLIKWLSKIKMFDQIIVMLQKEVVERIIAEPGNKNFGRLAIICQILCEVEKCFDIDPEAFYPAPKVTSSVVSLKPRSIALYDIDINKLEKFTNVLFSQKRKMIRAVLKGKITNLETIAAELNIDLAIRAEDLTLKQICDLSRYYI